MLKSQKKLKMKNNDFIEETGNGEELMTFGEHLEALRKMLFQLIGIVGVLIVVIFTFKTAVWKIILAPSSSDFILYRFLQKALVFSGAPFRFENFDVKLINTELASQFMLHLQTTAYFALLASSPYIVYRLFRYISPALYEHEKRYSIALIFSSYGLFALGLLVNYFIVFPFSFRFLGTYQVDESITNTITLASYITSFTTLSLMMGLVFQIPILAYFLAKFKLITADLLKKYRRYALFIIVVVAAIITPPDIFSCILTTIPMYLLYEVSIRVVKKV